MISNQDSALILDQVAVAYDSQEVVRDVSFTLPSGTSGALLGPSGCGKTTLLRSIAGFQDICRGSISLGGKPLTTPASITPPEDRQTGMVFQDFALFPHLNVADNIAFGIHKAPDKNERVFELLRLVELSGLERRYPAELSGGQQQRVALARALAPSPKLLLLDEPFSSLDIQLRRQLASEVKDILHQQKVTALLVTHDHEEAFSFADKVGVMNGGSLHQWDSPWNLYHLPKTAFVASFVGQGRLIPGRVNANQDIDTQLGVFERSLLEEQSLSGNVKVLIRPDDLVLDENGPIKASIRSVNFSGPTIKYEVEVSSHADETPLLLECQVESHNLFKINDQIRLRLELPHVVAYQS